MPQALRVAFLQHASKPTLSFQALKLIPGSSSLRSLSIRASIVPHRRCIHNFSREFPRELAGRRLEGHQVDRFLRERLFYTPAFEIYKPTGAVEAKGLYDYGPPGVALLRHITDLWRRHFVFEEDMLELDCTSITPHEVLKTSGHVEKFTDSLCQDAETGVMYRTDHLIKNQLEARLKGHETMIVEGTRILYENGEYKQTKKNQILSEETVEEYERILAKLDGLNLEQLAEVIQKHDISSPHQTELSPPHAFNLMFPTSIGPQMSSTGFLRPETAQGQFVNFSKLCQYNNLKMPFASACIGKTFRNEISPQSGLLRSREFMIAEIEHYTDPETERKHPRFHEVVEVELPVITQEAQAEGEHETNLMTTAGCIESKIISNETLGYFLARTMLFLTELGIDPSKIRFRQHQSSELAHYASDCWDVEVHTSYGWVECVGIADRAAFDLSAHSARVGSPLVVHESLSEPYHFDEYVPDVNVAHFGTTLRHDAEPLFQTLKTLPQATLEAHAKTLAAGKSVEITIPSGRVCEVPPEFASIKKVRRTVTQRHYTPSVIEPSFGLSRLFYCLLEHSTYVRTLPNGEDEMGPRPVLALSPRLAPWQCLLVPVSASKASLTRMDGVMKDIVGSLRKANVDVKADVHNWNVGKRYVKHDSLGTPLAITVDEQTLMDDTATLRERNSRKQVRGPIEEIVKAVVEFSREEIQWPEVEARLPLYTHFKAEEEDGDDGPLVAKIWRR